MCEMRKQGLQVGSRPGHCACDFRPSRDKRRTHTHGHTITMAAGVAPRVLQLTWCATNVSGTMAKVDLQGIPVPTNVNVCPCSSWICKRPDHKFVSSVPVPSSQCNLDRVSTMKFAKMLICFIMLFSSRWGQLRVTPLDCWETSCLDLLYPFAILCDAFPTEIPNFRGRLSWQIFWRSFLALSGIFNSERGM